MSQPFVGEVRAFGFTFARGAGWLVPASFCRSSKIARSFSILGTQYGGNGTTTFALPNVSGRVVLSQGRVPA